MTPIVCTPNILDVGEHNRFVSNKFQNQFAGTNFHKMYKSIALFGKLAVILGHP